jgi:hypothetical protein
MKESEARQKTCPISLANPAGVIGCAGKQCLAWRWFNEADKEHGDCILIETDYSEGWRTV